MNPPTQAAVLLALAALTAPPPRPRRPAGSVAPARRIPPTSAAVALALALAAPATLRGHLPVPVAIAGALAAITVGLRRRRLHRLRHRRAEGRAMADALEMLVGEFRIGADPVRAFTVTAAESTGVTGASLRAVAARARLGADVTEGIRTVAMASPVGGYWNRLAVCWDLATVHGLPVSALMRAAQRDVTDRQRFADRMDAALAGSRATAMILAGLPVLGVLLGQLIGAHPLRFLLATRPGGCLLLIGTALLCAGIIWSDRIIDGFAR